MLEEELFRQGRLEMSASPMAEPAAMQQWNDLLPNKIAVVLSVALVLIYLKDIIRLLPSLLYALDRKKGSESLEYNVSTARMRNTVARIYTLPFCLAADRYAIYRPDFWEAIPAGWSSAATFGTLLAYYLLRCLCYTVIRPKKLNGDGAAALRHSLYNYFIVLTSVAVPLVGILPQFGLPDATTGRVLLAATGLAFAASLVRAWQILRSRHSALPTFLYLCGLEILPAAAVAVSAVIL